MKTIKLITNLIYLIAIVFLFFITLATAFSVIKGPGGIRFFVVQSGSMEPNIYTGSVVLVAPQKDYQEKDIVTFLANPKANLKEAGATVTHRIVKVNDDEGRINYQTKGDANEDPDRELVAKGSVLGKVRFTIPFLGYIVAFSKTQKGFLLLIVIPASLIIYSELNSIKNEIKKMYAGWKSRKPDMQKKTLEGVKKTKIAKKPKKKKQ